LRGNTAALDEAGAPVDAVQMIPSQDRAWVGEMLGLAGAIDLVIPRGGKSLTERIASESRVPTLLHLDGNCHSYVHPSADTQKAMAVIVNAKMRRTGICGALESLLVDVGCASETLPALVQALRQAGCVRIKGDKRAQTIVSDLGCGTGRRLGYRISGP
jgi:glutamate-5-semialdehyde dehydrogenase